MIFFNHIKLLNYKFLVPFSSIAGSCFGLFFSLILAKFLSINEFGQYSFALTFINIFIILTVSGLSVGYLKEKKELNINMINIFIKKAIFTLMSLFILTILACFYFNRIEHYFLLSIVMFFLSAVAIELIMIPFVRLKDYLSISQLTLISNFLKIFLLCIFYYFIRIIDTQAISLILVFSSLFVFIFLYTTKVYKVNTLSKNISIFKLLQYMLSFYRKCFKFNFNIILFSLLSILDLWFLKYFYNFDLVAEFALCLNIVMLVMVPFNALNQKIFQNLIYRNKNNNAIVLKVLKYYLFFSFAIYFILFLTPDLIEYVFKNKFSEAINFFYVMQFNILFLPFLTLLGIVLNEDSLVLKKTKILLIILFLKIPIGVYLIKYFSIFGATLSFTIFNIVLLVLYSIVCNTKLSLPYFNYEKKY